MNNLMVIDGIEVRRDAYGRYSLNDLHRAAVASGANARTKEPGKFLSSQQITELVQELIDTQNLGVGSFNETTQNLGSKPVSKIEGRNGGTYVCKELVYAYAMWISPSFHLKVIRTFDMVTSAPEKLSGQAADKMQAGVILLDFMRRELTHQCLVPVRNFRRLLAYRIWHRAMPLMLLLMHTMAQVARHCH